MNFPDEKNLLDFSESDRMPRQLEHRFLKALAARVEEDLFPGKYPDYLEHFYQSGYHQTISRRTGQLAEELLRMYKKNSGDSADPALYALLDQEFAGLLDQFIILHCQKLHGFHLPEAILRYASRKKDPLILRKMIFDYLCFAAEKETVYTDLVQLSSELLKNAMHSFLLPGSQEKIFFICDQSVFGSCKEGFAMTDQALYWKAHLHPASMVAYHEIESLCRDNGDWITINDQYFNVNPSLNIKLYMLLKKLKRW